jgi:transcription elongation factor Elf1
MKNKRPEKEFEETMRWHAMVKHYDDLAKTINLETLKCCPFCGRKPDVSCRASSLTNDSNIWTIYCHCGTHSAHAHQFANSAEEVVAKWNSRK